MKADKPGYWVLKMTFFNAETRQMTEFGEMRNKFPRTEAEFKVSAMETIEKETKPLCWEIKKARKPKWS